MPDQKEELFARCERAVRELAAATRELKALGVTDKEFDDRLEPVMHELEGTFDDEDGA